MAASMPPPPHQQPHPRKQDEPDSVSLFQTVDWSCCCCSRRTGILVLGVCFLALSLGALVACAMEATKLRASLHLGPGATPPPPLLSLPASKVTTPTPKMELHPQSPLPDQAALDAHARSLQQGVLGLLTAQALVAAAGALAALLLMGGAWLGRAAALLPWMAVAAAQVALLTVGGLYCLCASMSRPLPVLRLDGFFALVLMFLFCVPVLYCLLAVGTYYRELTGSKYSECRTSAGVEAQSNGIEHITNLGPTSSPPQSPTGPPPLPSLPPPKRQAPRPPILRQHSEGHENPAFQSTAF